MVQASGLPCVAYSRIAHQYPDQHGSLRLPKRFRSVENRLSGIRDTSKFDSRLFPIARLRRRQSDGDDDQQPPPACWGRNEDNALRWVRAVQMRSFT